MGSKVWFKNMISKKKEKGERSDKLKRSYTPEKINEYKEEHFAQEESHIADNGDSTEGHTVLNTSIEHVAATTIQSEYRAYMARKKFRQLKGMGRLQNLMQCDSVKKQALATLSSLHSWSRIQGQIKARRVRMVTEGRLRQKKLENQLKLEAKLHDLEVEWSGGAETMDEALAKIHQREEAAVRRERAMAYAFSHQWRANSNPILGSTNGDISKGNWGWSWTDRWIAAQPWESRVAAQSSPKKAQSHQASKTGAKPNSPAKAPKPLKSISPDGNAARKARKLSYEPSDKNSPRKVKTKTEIAKTKTEVTAS